MKGSIGPHTFREAAREPLFPDSRQHATQSCDCSGHCVAMEINGWIAREPLREVLMRAIGGFVSLLVVALIGMFIYRNYVTSLQATGAATPVQTINVVGVKNDLLSIAQAERTYQAEHNSIASLDELVSSGEMSIKKSGRDGYTYAVESSGDGFRVTARCSASVPGCTNYAVDQTMEVRAEP
jgi:hypothetical protein